MDRPAEIQFHRRQQRCRRGAARRADRGGRLRCSSARAARSRPTASPAGRRATGRCASSWSHKLKRDAGIACTADDILIMSGSLQALDLVNGALLDARRHRDHRAGQLPGHDQPAHAARRQQRSASRSTATACAWTRSPPRSTISSARGVRPKYIYTIPTVQNPTGTILPEARRAEMLRLADAIRRADLRGRLLCRPDLGRQAPARALRDEQDRERDPHRLVLEVDRAGAARRLHRRALGR